MRGADYLIKTLDEHNVQTIFGYPGGAIMPVYDAIVDSKIKHILCRHEQAAVFAADGYARASGKLGVCLATSGPGATNLITGIANAYMDSIPLLAITGQVNSDLIGTDAFQEIDMYGMSMPVVKHSFLVNSIEQLPQAIHQAIEIAQEGRPGPVVIDITKDVQIANIQKQPYLSLKNELTKASIQQMKQACYLLERSRRPLIYAGGGIELAKATTKFRQLVEQLQVPTITSLKGIGTLPSNHPLNLGMLGMHGTKAANKAVQQCDLLICIGARFDDRATGKLDQFAKDAKIVHFDCDNAEIDKLKNSDCFLLGDLSYNLQEMKAMTSKLIPSIQVWRNQCAFNKAKHQFQYQGANTKGIYAPYLLHRLSQMCSTQSTIISCDVGQHQMWVAQHMQFNNASDHLSSGGLGAMGYGLPAAIGAKLAKPEAQVINVSGDGSIMMNIQELATLHRYGIPVKIVLIDNQRLGMVRQWQQLFFQQRYSEVELSDNPDFCQLAKAFGMKSAHLTDKSHIDSALSQLIDSKDSYLLHVSIDPDENVWPLVPPGKSNAEYIEETGL